MTERFKYTWQLDGFVGEQRCYLSDESIDINAPSVPVAILSGDARTHIESGLTRGKNYYTRISAYKNGVEKFSDEKKVLFGKAWTPANLTNLAKIWVDTDSDMTLVGQLVSSIVNKGSIGGTFTQSINASQPSLLNVDGLKGLIFYEDDYLALNNAEALAFANNVKSVFIFAVVSNIAARLTDNASIIFSSPDQNANPRVELNAGYGKTLPTSKRPYGYASRTSSGPWQDVKPAEEVTSGLLYTQFDFNGGQFKFKLNGNSAISQTYASLGNTQASNGHPSGIGIGGAAYSSLHRFNGTLHAIVASSDYLPTDDELKKLEGWAAHKYGLVSSLPDEHPYKDLVPVL